MATRRHAIVGFIHVCMINNYLDILTEQMQLIKDSGLYDAMNCCNVCCIGPPVELENVQKLMGDKFQLGPHCPSVTVYEFHTLKFMYEVVLRNPEFYGFYVHSKGVSWPNHPGGKYWRDYMNYYVLTKWRDDVKLLDKGYDTCGVKLINKGWPMHYSGNFFWFNSMYAGGLVDVNKMNLKDRFNAEMWICSGKPIAATLCQDFVDYNTEGVFEPPKETKCACKTIHEYYKDKP